MFQGKRELVRYKSTYVRKAFVGKVSWVEKSLESHKSGSRSCNFGQALYTIVSLVKS